MYNAINDTTKQYTKEVDLQELKYMMHELAGSKIKSKSKRDKSTDDFCQFYQISPWVAYKGKAFTNSSRVKWFAYNVYSAGM